MGISEGNILLDDRISLRNDDILYSQLTPVLMHEYLIGEYAHSESIGVDFLTDWYKEEGTRSTAHI